jgi:hypothetical protein
VAFCHDFSRLESRSHKDKMKIADVFPPSSGFVQQQVHSHEGCDKQKLGFH